MKKVELLAPAGDILRGKMALDFGADAIYLGAQQFSLRARSSNFDFNALKEIDTYAKKNNKKIYLVTNILATNFLVNDFNNFLDEVLKYCTPDAFICGDPYIIEVIKKRCPKAQIHITTQQSISNSKAALFWNRNGADRIILSREVSYNELVPLIKNVENKIDIEVFIHGAVCIAYSGRCMLSNNFTYRDANIGGCAQSCRWNCDMYDEEMNLIAKNFTMSAKDMAQMKNIPKLIDAGVKSFKIEGRMKSEYYLATVVNAYKNQIEFYNTNNKLSAEFENDLYKAANRMVSTAWFDGLPGIDKMLYHDVATTVKQNYAFSIKEKLDDTTYLVFVRNFFDIKNMKFEILSKNYPKNFDVEISNMNINNIDMTIAKTPMSIAKIIFSKPLNLSENDIGRIK